jgi:hypothetical protein
LFGLGRTGSATPSAEKRFIPYGWGTEKQSARGNYPESPDSCGAASGSGGELDEVLLAPALGGFFPGSLVGEDGSRGRAGRLRVVAGQPGGGSGQVCLGELPPFGLDADAVQLGDGEFDAEAEL